ncbi:PepSY domain-containing protein [Ferrimonas senticii]|uniref:PepSY domain-containing protein n=1 Tax=Ferrimonas senticii TaxID=394566 RepID=UPI0003F4DF42|nr:PepSY domain-containing protein [Ferrimonas senticii]
MKALIALPLLLCSVATFAAPSSLYQKLQQANPSPLQIIALVEQQYRQHGQIIEFEVEQERGQIVYEVTLANDDRQITEMELSASGELLSLEQEAAESDDQASYDAIEAFSQRYQSLSQLLKATIGDTNEQLYEAQLDANRGIHFLEIELLGANGKRKLALNLDTGKQLPILQWD